MNGVTGYGAYQDHYYKSTVQSKKEIQKSGHRQEKKTSEVKLSEGAEALLEKLKKTYGNMDFMVADYDSDSDARDILSKGTREFSVLFSAEELEKMASDETYEKECLHKMESAVRMSRQINEQYGFRSANGEQGQISKVGIAFNKDGTVRYFAELEKTTQKQRERIEQGREEKAAERREPRSTQKTVVWADSMEELLQKLDRNDWESVPGRQEEGIGGKIDFSI